MFDCVQFLNSGLEEYLRWVFLQRIAEAAVEAYDRMLLSNATIPLKLTEVGLDMYRDTDIPSRLPADLGFSPLVSSFTNKTVLPLVSPLYR